MGRICHLTQVKTGVISFFLPSFLASLLLSFLLHPPSIHLKPYWPSFQNISRTQILLHTFTSTILGPATSISHLHCNSGFLVFLPASLPVPFTFRTRVILIKPKLGHIIPLLRTFQSLPPLLGEKLKSLQWPTRPFRICPLPLFDLIHQPHSSSLFVQPYWPLFSLKHISHTPIPFFPLSETLLHQLSP